MRIDINIAAMVLLGVVYLIACGRLDRQDILNKKFLSTSRIILLGILFETLTCIINRRPELWLIPVSVLMHIGVFVTAPILTYFWYIFIYSWIIPNTVISRKKQVLLLIPVVINAIITVLSPVFGWVFYITSSNIYHRGNLFVVSSAIIYFYLLYGLALVLKRRNKFIKQDFIPLFSYGILPIIGGLIQTLFYGTLVMWSSSAFSMVIIYIFLQQRMIHLDSLTGAWTRESFDNYIPQRMKQGTEDKFGIIYLDLDGLKQINDEYGHLEGDSAIKSAVQLLKSVLRKKDIIARLGGDEFVIVVDCNTNEFLDELIEKINTRFIQYNEGSEKKYKLECSIGADIYSDNFSSVEQFLHHVDNLMYSHKRMKKTN
ncbi:MAG: GGDEF domain-containing protein [Anaerocolumna sp.]